MKENHEEIYVLAKELGGAMRVELDDRARCPRQWANPESADQGQKAGKSPIASTNLP